MDRIGLKPYALVTSSGMECEGDEECVPVDWEELASRLVATAAERNGVPVVADVTASSVVQEEYEGLLKKGITVAAANKGIFAGPEEKYQALLAAADAEPKSRLLHE